MKNREFNPEFRRAAQGQISSAQRQPLQKPQALAAPGASGDVMMNDTWKRYADSRLKQFSTR